MNIEIEHNGIRISDIVNGYRLSKLYIGYSKKEAIKQWNEEIGNR